ncbi:MAG TPA: hypothetical protein VHQ20_02795 [Patescibacteria group bacterium]|jgi:hypothetical protein|nr:hypothetical protein [Patescibacteria group bacterium]
MYTIICRAGFGLIVIFSAYTTVIMQPPESKVGSRYVIIPPKCALVIAQHLQTISKKGWGEAVPGDLYHGHLVMKAKTFLSEPVSVEQLCEQSAGVFYHSDEMLKRWAGEDDKLIFSERRPRSLLGYWSGSVQPAAQLFKNLEQGTEHYICCGTIHTDELANERPDEFAPRRDYKVLAADGKPCTVNLIIDIYYSSQREPTIQLNGRGYTLSMDCAK